MDISSAPFPSDGAKSGWIVDGTDQTFMQDVIEASRDTVVLVDFWAPWCGPCKTLTPNLEKVVNQAKGDVKLVKINIDENQGVAGQLGVRSVPTVYAFKDGRPIDGFQGALPESQLVDFIKRIGGSSTLEQIEQALEVAAQAFQSGDLDQAAGIYSQIIQAQNDNVDALAGLARCLLAMNEFDQARDVLAMIPEDAQKQPQVKSVLTALELVGDGQPQTDDELTALYAKIKSDPSDFDTRFDLAKRLSAKNSHDDAAEQLLIILEQDLAWNEGAAKEQLLKIFEAAGPKADVTKRGRRKLSSLLFS